jgi:hypothetical protein
MPVKSESALTESIYWFLVKNGYNTCAKSLVKEAKLKENALKKDSSEDLESIFTASKK